MNPKFFIIEGPDRSGKSTLAKHIAQHLNIRTNVIQFHLTYNRGLASAMLEYHMNVHQNLIDNFREHGCSVVLDRSWISNIVYGTVLNNQRVHGWTNLRAHLMNLGAVYVMCDCESVEERHNANPDPAHPYSASAFHEIVEMYRRIPHDCLFNDNVVRYDMDVHGKNLVEFMGELGI